MRMPRKHIRPSTVFFVAAIAVLGSVLLIQERKAARLRAALIYYKSQSRERVVDRLHGKALLKWADDCPLEEVVEQVRRTTATGKPGARPVFPLGIPIEVDPIGLERAGQSLKSPVPSPPADVNLTLAEKLRAVLEPLGLACDVRDASLVITARDLVTSPVRPEDQEDE
jgi:hypothetical protein